MRRRNRMNDRTIPQLVGSLRDEGLDISKKEFCAIMIDEGLLKRLDNKRVAATNTAIENGYAYNYPSHKQEHFSSFASQYVMFPPKGIQLAKERVREVWKTNAVPKMETLKREVKWTPYGLVYVEK